MNEDRRNILGMLAAGKITADEAERLIAALGEALAGAAEPQLRTTPPKYLCVNIDAVGRQSVRLRNVNINVPMQLLRDGVRLGALLPASARDELNEALARKGVAFDVSQVKPENLDALLAELNDVTVDVDDGRAKVRVFCE